MRITIRLALVGIIVVALAACGDSDAPTTPGGNSRVEVSSDPEGAMIFLGTTNTGKVTPDLLRDLPIGRVQDIQVRLDRDNITYGFSARIEIKSDSLHRVLGPLLMRCQTTTCALALQKFHTLGNTRVSTLPNGALFYMQGQGQGLVYPVSTANSYVAAGLPLIGLVAGTRDTLALGLYSHNYLAGRPAPQVTQTADRYTLRQSFWVLPAVEVIVALTPTVRGIEVEEELISVSAEGDVAFVKLTFRNITNRPAYRAADPIVPSGAITYQSVYVGFGVDADIGEPNDDAVTYDPALDMVYTYDMNFQDAEISGGFTDRPALVGLRLLQAPPGAAVKVLNAWPAAGDWRGGDSSERVGWGVLSGLRSFLPDIAGQQIGHAPVNTGDYRMSVSAGPLTLAPGESVSMTVAVIVAPPVQGSYSPGQAVVPDNPTTADRQIDQVAATLRQKAASLVVPQ